MGNPFQNSVYFVGIKGTGTSALAELMREAGLKVSGSDTSEAFYTDAILKELNISFYENFDAKHITSDIDIVIHSAAYSAETNPELAEAIKQNIPVVKYPDALGLWSEGFDSAGICGVHGKTTTTALAGVLMRAVNIPAQILVGAAVAGFGGRSTLTVGSKYFVAETCEYRRHFLAFKPKHIILTSVECDHQDCFPDFESIRDAFIEYCLLLPPGGEIIYCADDSGACEVVQLVMQSVKKEGREIKLVPYGFTASGDYRIVSYNVKNERGVFSLAGIPGEIKLQIPGRHQALNAAAAIALAAILAEKEQNAACGSFSEENVNAIKTALENFTGSKRRSEIIGRAGGIIFMDDYGHHPTAIKTSLAGIKSFYPSRRLIVSFMSHTYTRTAALLDEFAACFNDADFVFLHKIYSSAREKYSGGVNGMTLYERVKAAKQGTHTADGCDNADNGDAARNGGGADTVFYFEEPDDAFRRLLEILKPGDIFLTLGAGNNWPLGEKLLNYFNSIDAGKPGESEWKEEAS